MRAIVEPRRRLAALRPQPLEPLEGERFDAFHEREQLGVLLAVGDRVQPQGGRLQRRVELREAKSEIHPRAPDDDRVAQRGEALDVRLAGVRPQLVQPHEVGVRVEHDDSQAGLEQQPLEHDAERVRLPGPRLPAQERVPAEPARVERDGDARCEKELAHRHAGATRGKAGDVPRDLVGRGGPDGGVVKRPSKLVEQSALSDRVPDRDLHAHAGAGVGLRDDIGAGAARQLERQHLPQPAARRRPRARRTSRARRPGRAATPGTRSGARPATSRAGAPPPRATV